MPIPAHSVRDDIPVWADAALAKAVEKKPSQRTDALSALLEDLKRPNPSLGYDRLRPLLERNPHLFWKGLSVVLLIINVALLLLLAR